MAEIFAMLYASSAALVAFSIALMLSAEGFRTPLSRAFGYVSCGTLVWNLAHAMMSVSSRAETVFMIYRVSSIGWAVNPSLSVYYAYRLYCEYSRRTVSSRVVLLIFVPVPFIWFGILSGRLLAVGFSRTANGWIERVDPASIANYVFIALLLVGMGAFAFMGWRLFKFSGTKRARLHGKLITIPVVAMVVLIAIFHIVLPMRGAAVMPPIVQVLLALWIVVVSLLLHRYPVFSMSPRIAADAIVNSMSDICLLVDNDGFVIGANPALADLLGHEAKASVGRSLSDFMPREVRDSFAEASEGGERVSMETTLRSVRGAAVPCVVSVNAVRDSLNDPVGFVVIARETREEQRLKLLSETDGLTGVYNRRKMENAISELLSEPRRLRRSASVIMIDIDNFKSINDRFGHDTGDKVIQHLCSVVTKSIRGNDLFARWGGEEFVVLCVDTAEADAAALAERIRKRIAGHAFSHGEGVTASFGVSMLKNSDTLEALIGRADQALYRSKSEGRNRVSVCGG